MTTRPTPPPRHRARVTATLAATLVLSSCAAAPGPPPVVEETETPTTTTQRPRPEAERTSVTVGVDPFRGGLNPHLIADYSAEVDQIAALVLPSAFRDGEPDPDLLVSAEEIAPAAGAAQTVRYVIAPGAQWSDGTPVSGADFEYLWRGITETPGVLARGGYDTVSQVRISGGGKTVEVDFARPNAGWRELFSDLLPAHLLRGGDFAEALVDGIPASAGRYAVRDFDKARGTVELQRNDRFWGADPAVIDVVHLRPVSGVLEASDQLRTGQAAFMDLTPKETTEQALELVAGAQTRTRATGRRLRLSFNTTSEVLSDAAGRGAAAALIDVPTVARIAAGRSVDVRVPENPAAGQPVDEAALARLRAAAGKTPVRIGADPADPQAAAASRVVVDQLRAAGVDAWPIAADLDTLTRTSLPEGAVDAVVSWSRAEAGPQTSAGRYGCSGEPEGARGTNLSGYCTSYTQRFLDAAVAGEKTAAQLAEHNRDLEIVEHLGIGLLDETRLEVLGRGITGPDADLDGWPGGITTAPGWRLDGSAQAPAARTGAGGAAEPGADLSAHGETVPETPRLDATETPADGRGQTARDRKER